MNSYVFVNGVEIHIFKAKYSAINAVLLCVGNISKDFSVDNMEKTELHGHVYNFSANYDSIDVDNIVDIHKCLMKKHKIMFRLMKQAFIHYLVLVIFEQLNLYL